MEYQLEPGRDLAVQIADQIRAAILRADLLVDARLPSEAELAERFEVSRPTVREALKRLAAQNLIRTQRGATGGAFVNRLSFAEAASQQEITATLVLSMNAVDFETACEARYALERACAPLAAARRTDSHLAALQAELRRQSDPGLDDAAFCASDVAFHRVLVEAADNPVLSYQLAGAVEGMQPLMNMITHSERSRARIVDLHGDILDGLAARDGARVDQALSALALYTAELGSQSRAKRAAG
ncbi:regulatory protein [Dinoroseobacter shibae DFL 12 = DSM 16493]|jgi:DNA-binding FadR family transcriptional regulator|uniref:Regulatory protein n=1 Tax=Dinoroseobacter shibae (strain DSM 16493 / NCIMB 14021 / DFL 12) TaxID=398580 RepID=A8LRM9_DINSH|nr:MULTISPECIES: FCD domain-containing protein [Dinoroseobacter]ABV94060.1 regulatory protein [Dinoroseobacter shibae DFL 12 = DSM 16493]MDD9716430.1 GntR family transcriptional regulator [Dinoroseobacter sp. PD6]URF45501.1 GntR family transcriptional regulator [Dinoroseobacter shibae]URF49806.1 GntR family transcriptional regulator [Dinoroseobacter shibae]